MPKFESSLGAKSFVGQEMQEFDVPDGNGYQEEQSYPPSRGRPFPSAESSIREFQSRMQSEQENPAEVERQIREAKEMRRTGKERLNDGAKRRIEMLIGMTRTTREVSLEGNIFILQSLKSKDMRDAIIAASEFDGTVQSPFEIRKQLLARSLVQIAGVDIAQFLGSDDLKARLYFIDEQVEAVLNRLYAEYLELVRDSDAKYSIKTPIEAQEVVEDLKK